MENIKIQKLLEDVISRVESNDLPVIDPVYYDDKSEILYINNICANIREFNVDRTSEYSVAEVTFQDGELERVICNPNETLERILICSIAQHVGKEIYTRKGIKLLVKKIEKYESVKQVVKEAKKSAIETLLKSLG